MILEWFNPRFETFCDLMEACSTLSYALFMTSWAVSKSNVLNLVSFNNIWIFILKGAPHRLIRHWIPSSISNASILKILLIDSSAPLFTNKRKLGSVYHLIVWTHYRMSNGKPGLVSQGSSFDRTKPRCFRFFPSFPAIRFRGRRHGDCASYPL